MSKQDQMLQKHGTSPGDGIAAWRQRYGISYGLTAKLLSDPVAHVEGHDIATWEKYGSSAAAGLALKALLALPDDVVLKAIAEEPAPPTEPKSKTHASVALDKKPVAKRSKRVKKVATKKVEGTS